MKNLFQDLKRKDHKRYLGGLDVFKYIGPGLLVTVGFIDPGNWASNFAAGSEFGYSLLWVVTLSTIMLIILQHNVAHLGLSPDFAFRKLPPNILPNGYPVLFLVRRCWLPSLLRWQRFWVEPSHWKCCSIFLLYGELC